MSKAVRVKVLVAVTPREESRAPVASSLDSELSVRAQWVAVPVESTVPSLMASMVSLRPLTSPSAGPVVLGDALVPSL